MTKRSTAALLVNAALIWHAVTAISGQRESRADQHLRCACIRHIKASQPKRRRRVKPKRGAR